MYHNLLYVHFHILFTIMYIQSAQLSGSKIVIVSVPDSKSRNIPEVVVVRRWAVGILGFWRGGVGWVKGGANGVSLQAT